MTHFTQTAAQHWQDRALIRVAAYLCTLVGEDLLRAQYSFLLPTLAAARARYPVPPSGELAIDTLDLLAANELAAQQGTPESDALWAEVENEIDKALRDLLHRFVPEVGPLPTRPTDKSKAKNAKQAKAAKEVKALTPIDQLRLSGVNNDQLLSLMLIGLVENDARLSAIYGTLHPFPDELYLTVGLLQDLLNYRRAPQQSRVAPNNNPAPWTLICDLEARGLVTLHHPERPRSARTLSIPAPLWEIISGECSSLPTTTTAITHHTQSHLTTFADLDGLLPSAIIERLRNLATTLTTYTGQKRTTHVDETSTPSRSGEAGWGSPKRTINGVILRGMKGSGRQRAIAALARAGQRDLLHIEVSDLSKLPALCHLAGPLATLLGALPLFEINLAPGESVKLPPLAGYSDLVAVSLNREGTLIEPANTSFITLHLPAPDIDARRKQWGEQIDCTQNGNQQVIEQVSRTHHLTLGGIERSAKLAHLYAEISGRDHISAADIQEACSAINQQSLESLAKRIPTSQRRDHLILPPDTQAELQKLIQRCLHRESLLARLGAGFKGTTRGVRCLLTGPSGTGKTLAARIIAAELGLELYRVELSAVVSKYIGETERNLSQLFARAEEADVVLLLDEGDSLLTARTDVRNSTDRYANMETNYLLQRLEDYEGILIITSNAASRIDNAFQRRMDVVINFGTPDASARHQLWQLHLPTQHAIDDALLQSVAQRCTLTGGQIRNAALHATLLATAAETGPDTPIRGQDVIAGVQREYTKQGATAPQLG